MHDTRPLIAHALADLREAFGLSDDQIGWEIVCKPGIATLVKPGHYDFTKLAEDSKQE